MTRSSDLLAPECLRTLDNASRPMCSTWICTSGASGKPWPDMLQRRGDARLVLELGQRRAQCHFDVLLACARAKCTSSSRTSE